MQEPIFFSTPADFRRWLSTNYKNIRELWVGFYKKGSGRPSMTWPESVDEALCVGWIDGLRKTIDGQSYRIRFTPRKPTSNWSAVNIGRVQELTRQGRMRPAGLKAFELCAEKKSGIYSYENRHAAVLSKSAERKFRAHLAAWEFFQRQPAGYRKTTIWWVMSARREETRQKRLKTLIADSAARRRIGALTRLGKAK
jgi:uncharacterized protein YdeI (YjbR/CyaY-like superfamily)